MGCCSKLLSTTLTSLIYANVVKMKQFDWLHENKFSIHIDEELQVFKLVNPKIGGAIKGPKTQFNLKNLISVIWSHILSSVL